LLLISWEGKTTNRWRGLKSFSFYLMKITRLKLLDAASSGLTQEEFQFPDEGQ
jgi:hypothetical protein